MDVRAMEESHDRGNEIEQDYAKIRRWRNLAVAGVLVAVVVIFFLMTIVRIGNFYGP
jgi:hypothetical protein